MKFSIIRSLATFPIRNIKRLLWSFQFGHFGKKSWIDAPLRIEGKSNIYIGNRVGVHHKSWLAALPLTGADSVRLVLEDNTVIGDFNHIFATQSIHIEKSVLTANYVYISDNLHDYSDINTPIINQPIIQQKEVIIGEGSWLGEHVCIIGACVGKHCVIGANSVVTRDIPNYCVAVGAPAHVIKRYNPKSQQWEKTDKNGNFLEQ